LPEPGVAEFVRRLAERYRSAAALLIDHGELGPAVLLVLKGIESLGSLLPGEAQARGLPAFAAFMHRYLPHIDNIRTSPASWAETDQIDYDLLLWSDGSGGAGELGATDILHKALEAGLPDRESLAPGIEVSNGRRGRPPVALQTEWLEDRVGFRLLVDAQGLLGAFEQAVLAFAAGLEASPNQSAEAGERLRLLSMAEWQLGEA
jgi:hypothetical protein